MKRTTLWGNGSLGSEKSILTNHISATFVKTSQVLINRTKNQKDQVKIRQNCKMMELEFDSGGDDDGNVAVFLQTMKILSSCFWQQLINFAVYVFLRRFSLPAPLSFQKKRSFHFIWISQNLLGLLIRGGKALIQGQISNPQPSILVLLTIGKVFKLAFLHVLFNSLFYGLRRFSWIGRSLAEQRFSQR